MSELKYPELRGLRCPWCNSHELYYISRCHELTEPIGFSIVCSYCYMYGPIGKTKSEALSKFRQSFEKISDNKNTLKSQLII